MASANPEQMPAPEHALVLTISVHRHCTSTDHQLPRVLAAMLLFPLLRGCPMAAYLGAESHTTSWEQRRCAATTPGITSTLLLIRFLASTAHFTAREGACGALCNSTSDFSHLFPVDEPRIRRSQLDDTYPASILLHVDQVAVHQTLGCRVAWPPSVRAARSLLQRHLLPVSLARSTGCAVTAA